MALSPLQLFRALASEYSRKNNDEVNDMVEVVTPRIDATAYGDRYNEALAQAAAHEFELESRRARAGLGLAGSGPVTGQSGPSGSLSYAAPDAPVDSYQDALWKSTTHGLALLGIRDAGCGGFGVFT